MQEVPIVLIGHKDHGRSTLIGRLIVDSGSVKESPPLSLLKKEI